MAIAADTESTRRTRLTPEREAELFAKILDLLVEEGYDNLTMDTIANCTRSSKATLYRQWQSKPRLVAATLRCAKQHDHPEIDTGSLAGDLRELAHYAGTADQEQVGIFWSMADTVRRNPELREALHEALIEPAQQELGVMMRRAIDRGEITCDLPCLDFIHNALVGAVLFRSMTEDGTADSTYLVRYVDAVILPALGLTAPVGISGHKVVSP